MNESNLQTNPAPVPQPVVPPKKLSGWGTFMGVLLIINGAIISLTIILAVFGIPLIVAGVKLLKAITISGENTSCDPRICEVFDNLNSFFKINGIVVICTVLVGIIGIIIALANGLFGLFIQSVKF